MLPGASPSKDERVSQERAHTPSPPQTSATEQSPNFALAALKRDMSSWEKVNCHGERALVEYLMARTGIASGNTPRHFAQFPQRFCFVDGYPGRAVSEADRNLFISEAFEVTQ